jgi:hypothetical protein
MQLEEIKSNYSWDWQKFIDMEAEEIQKQAKQHKRRLKWSDACIEAEQRLRSWVDDAKEERFRLVSLSQIASFVASHRQAKIWCTLIALSTD